MVLSHRSVWVAYTVDGEYMDRDIDGDSDDADSGNNLGIALNAENWQ